MMRNFLMATLAAAVLGLLPGVVLAANQNQEAAEKIASNLRTNGPKSDFKVGVRYLNGTVWLQGHVHDAEQLNKAVNLVLHTPGVTVKQVIRDDLKCGTAGTSTAAHSAPSQVKAPYSSINPLRGADGSHQAQALSSSVNNPRQATPTAMMQPVPPPPPTATTAPSMLPPPNASTGMPGAPLPMNAGMAGGPAPLRYDQPSMPNYAWPSYASYPNYAAVTYPKQYSPTAWPYIGPYYPYPQVPLGWRKVSLEWDDGWWWLDFKDKPRTAWWR
jgi:hypothetical protein